MFLFLLLIIIISISSLTHLIPSIYLIFTRPNSLYFNYNSTAISSSSNHHPASITTTPSSTLTLTPIDLQNPIRLKLISSVILTLHAILNLSSISILSSSADHHDSPVLRSFHLNPPSISIQLFNHTLLLSLALILIRSIIITSSDHYYPPASLRNHLNSIFYSSILIIIIIPLPCIILISISTESIRSLTIKSSDSYDPILPLRPTIPIDPSVPDIISRSIRSSTNLLLTHLRMLSALHLIFTSIILITSTSILSIIIRRSNPSYPQIHPTPPPHSHLSSSDPIISQPKLALDPHHPNQPQPALILKPNVGHQSVDRTILPDALVLTPHPYDDQTLKPHPVHNHPSQPPVSSCRDTKKIKVILTLIIITCLNFIVLNLCIVTNLFKCPDEISIDDLMILILEWSSWVWNGSISPLVGCTHCWLLFRSRKIKN